MPFSRKNRSFWHFFCCFGAFFLGKNRLFSYGWMSSLFAPYKNTLFFVYCGSPSHAFSSKNPLSAHVPRSSQKAPRHFAEGAWKASKKHPEKFPEGFQSAPRRLPGGSQKAPRRSNKAPGRFPEGSKRFHKTPRKAPKRLQEVPRGSQTLPEGS